MKALIDFVCFWRVHPDDITEKDLTLIGFVRFVVIPTIWGSLLILGLIYMP